MSTIKQWLRIGPLDTLFFKGSEPMIAGVSHEVRTVFPPMPATLVGAVRSAILGQRNIDPYQYTDGNNEDIIRQFPHLGAPDAPGFRLAGPLFEVTSGNRREVLLPAPAHWHGSPEEAESHGSMQVSAAEPATDLLKDVGLCGNTTDPLWLLDPRGNNIKSLAGWWANAAAIEAMANGKTELAASVSTRDIRPGQPAIFPLSALFVTEARTGIALDLPIRRVREGHLYSATHVRLLPGVAMLAGLSKMLCPKTLDPQGIMLIGGEQRVARYECLGEMDVVLPATGTGNRWALTVSTIPWAEFMDSELAGLPRASGPLIRMGGWDMKKRFHKDTTAWLPPGASVYLEDKKDLPFGFFAI